MTRPDFLRGYLLLTTQPWGKAYRTVAIVTDGEPNPAEIQLEFYYHALEKYEAEAWTATCEIRATGEHWPSIDALKLTLKAQRPKRPALPPPANGDAANGYCTKEEFGLNLYEAIKTIGGILGLDQQRAACIHRERPEALPEMETRRATLVKDFEHHRAILTHDELTQIIARYPWVRDL